MPKAKTSHSTSDVLALFRFTTMTTFPVLPPLLSTTGSRQVS